MLSSFPIMTGIVVISYSRLLRHFQTETLRLLKEQQRNIELLLVEENHGDEVAELAKPD